MYVAAYLSRMGKDFDPRALKLYRQVAQMDPSRFEPYMHGLDLAVRLGDVDGIQWACVGVLSQAWPADKTDVVDLARRTAFVTLKELRNQKRTAQANRFEAALNEAMIRDCVVQSHLERRRGSRFDGRGAVGHGLLAAQSAHDLRRRAADLRRIAIRLSDEGTSEQYVVTQGFPGKYRMLLRRVWGKPTAGKVTVEVYTHFGSKKATQMRKQIPAGRRGFDG